MMSSMIKDNQNDRVIVNNAHANNLKRIRAEIKYYELTVCVGASGSGKSSFAFNTLIQHEKCEILNMPEQC